MLAFDDIQHILLTRAPALTGRYEFLSFRIPANGRAWLAAILDEVHSAEAMRADKRWATVAVIRNGLRALGVTEPSLASFPGEFHQGIVARAKILGVTGANHLGNWVCGLASADLHAIVILFARDFAERERRRTEREKPVTRCDSVEVLSALDLEAPPPLIHPHGHFRDRFSQPVIEGSDDEPMGHGEVGDYLQSVAKEGKIVDTIAARILNGESPQDMPIVRGANAHMFDSGALRSWRFRESDLPPGSTVRFRPPTLWQRTKSKWVAAVAVVGCLSALVSYVRLKRRRDRQLALGGMLIRAQERERSRIASEIHDDFSQRLALMALELETAEEAIGASPDEAVRQVHNILNSASELGADLHTLSHRLHSSTLDRLGLVPGVTALCKEFAVQQGIEIDLLTDDVPRSVHPDAALCLFRIVQEGLRNLKKHSGATKAEVRLGRTDGKLFVSVSDEGIGFEVHDLGQKTGLGIRSMEERASLMGGRFEIHSKPGKGTRIEASVPIIERKKALHERRPVANQSTRYNSG
jgi:signal transduction histidine kinase